MIRHILFFATKEDLLPVLRRIEEREPLKYFPAGNFVIPKLQAFLKGAEIPDLGNATSESAHASASYLVCSRALPINVERFTAKDGVERFCVDQLRNPDTVGFTPAGIWNEDVMLHGRVATASDSKVSQALMRRFKAAIGEYFTKIKAFHVGPDAFKMLELGKRLTIAAQSPHEFDLKIGSSGKSVGSP